MNQPTTLLSAVLTAALSSCTSEHASDDVCDLYVLAAAGARDLRSAVDVLKKHPGGVCAPAEHTVLVERVLPRIDGRCRIAHDLLHQGMRAYETGATTLVNLAAHTAILEKLAQAGQITRAERIETLSFDVDLLVALGAKRRSLPEALSGGERVLLEQSWDHYFALASDLDAGASTDACLATRVAGRRGLRR